MKLLNILFLLAVVCVSILFSYNAKSQIYIRQKKALDTAKWNSKPFRSKNLKQFEGMWEYADAIDTFRIVLVRAIDTSLNYKQPIDCLYGLHYLKHKGEVVFDYLYNIDTISPRKATIWISDALPKGYPCDCSCIRLYAFLGEMLNGTGNVKLLEYGKTKKIKWEIVNWNLINDWEQLADNDKSLLKKTVVVTQELILNKIEVPKGYTNHLFNNMPASNMKYEL